MTKIYTFFCHFDNDAVNLFSLNYFLFVIHQMLSDTHDMLKTSYDIMFDAEHVLMYTDYSTFIIAQCCDVQPVLIYNSNLVLPYFWPLGLRAFQNT